MSRTTVSIADSTKDRLEHLKREDESFDELLRRLAAEEEPVDAGSWDEEDAENVRETIRRSKESIGK